LIFLGLFYNVVELIPVTVARSLAVLVSPVKPPISMPLIEGLRNEVFCRDMQIRELRPFSLTTFNTAFLLSLLRYLKILKDYGLAGSRSVSS
jgi:hypothetical protein